VACSEAQARFLLALDQSVLDRSAAAEVWQRLRLVLIDALGDQERYYYSALNDGRLTEQVLSADIARFLRDALGDTVAGAHHPLFTPLPIPGGRGNRRPQRILILVDRAVDYLTAVDLGLLPDRDAQQRVSEHYDVSLRQVRRWRTDAGDLVAREALMKARYQELIPGPLSRLKPTILRQLMEWGGDAYQQEAARKKQ
jgi:hypothetical protein